VPTTSSTADVAYVDVLPSMRNFLPTLRGATAGASATAGAESGRIFASSFADAVSSATARLSAAQKRAADAAGSLSVAQARLNELQTGGTASAARMAAAEEAVEKAQRNVALQTDNVARAQTTLTRVETEQAAAAEVATVKHRSLGGAMEGVSTRAGMLAGLLTGVNKAYSLMFAAATVALPVIPFVAATKAAGDYQSLLVKLVTTAGESNSNLKLVGDGMLKLAGQVGIGATDLARGMYTIESAGFHGADGLNVLKASAQGARQEQADLGAVANAVSTILHDYHKPASDAATVTSQLVTAVAHGKTTFEELTASLHSVTPVAAAMNIPLADIVGTLAAMTQSGETADQATENMRNALLTLQKPSQGMISELAQLGIQAADLNNMLSTKGLAGTLNTISVAILTKMGPAGRVMLDALNESQLGAQGLQQMLGTMSGNLKDLSLGLLNGSVSISQYRKAVRDMGSVAGASGLQFLSLYQQSDGFNQILKSGGPNVQNYTQALQRATGTQATFTVALQTTNKNAGSTAETIALIAKSTADAKGNIQGWSEVQGTFNQKLAQAHAVLGAMAIQLGTAMLPALSAFVGWVATHAVPGLEAFGHTIAALVHTSGFQEFLGNITGVIGSLITSVSRLVSEFSKSGGLHDLLTVIGVVGGAAVSAFTGLASLATGALSTMVHWFGLLPGPLQAAVVGFAALRIAAAAGLFDTILLKGLYVVDTLKAMGAAATVTGAEMVAAYREAAAASAFMASVAEESAVSVRLAGAASGAMAGLGAAAGAAARGGLAVIKTGLSGIVNLLGGPWGVALLGAAVGVGVLAKAISDSRAQVADWAQAMAKGGQTAATAQQQMQDAPGFWDRLGFSLTHAGTSIGIVGQRAKEARAAYDEWYKSLSPLDQKTQDVTKAQNDLAFALQKYGPTSSQASSAADAYRVALDRQSGTQDQLNQAEQTHLQRLQAIATQELAGINSALAAQQAELQLADAVAQYNSNAAAGTLTSRQLQEASNALAQQAFQLAQASATAAVDQAKSNGVTDLGTVANQAMLKSLQNSASQITGPGHDALMQMIATVQNATVGTGTFQDTVSKMGLEVVGTWHNNALVIHNATTAQIQDLNALGYTTRTLPNGNVTITANTQPGRDEIGAFIAFIQAKTAVLHFFSTFGLASGGLLLPNAGGNFLTPMQGGVGTIVQPNTWRVIGDNMQSKEAYIPIEPASQRSQGILATTASLMGYTLVPSSDGAVGMAFGGVLHSGGGTFPPINPMPQNMAIPTHLTFNLTAQQVTDKVLGSLGVIGGALPAGSAGGAARWSNLVLQALAMDGQPASLLQTVLRRMNQESGGNPAAINRTDINWQRGTPSVGLMQVIGPTYRAYHDPRRDVGPYVYGTSEDPLSNILASFRYAIARYGSLSSAFNRGGGYDDGGLWESGTWGLNTTGSDERVLTPAQDNYFRRFVDTTSHSSSATSTPIWHFHLGDREITDLVDVRLEWHDNAMARDVRSAH
jgi:Phage-related minor tail protein/Transglycosylase SLT domain